MDGDLNFPASVGFSFDELDRDFRALPDVDISATSDKSTEVEDGLNMVHLIGKGNLTDTVSLDAILDMSTDREEDDNGSAVTTTNQSSATSASPSSPTSTSQHMLAASTSVPNSGITKPGQKPKRSAQSALARKRGNNNHTRRCRQKVNDRFEELLKVLPAPSDPKAHPIKHKAQILEYSISRIREITTRNRYLELMLAMSSRVAMNAWIDAVASRSPTLAHALVPYMELICTTRGWKYAELWECREPREPSQPNITEIQSSREDTGGLRYIASQILPSLDQETTQKLEALSEVSRKTVIPISTEGVSAVVTSQRPGWLPRIVDSDRGARCAELRKNDIRESFAVPVCRSGVCVMLVKFFDTAPKGLDSEVLKVAFDIADTLAQRYPAQSRK